MSRHESSPKPPRRSRVEVGNDEPKLIPPFEQQDTPVGRAPFDNEPFADLVDPGRFKQTYGAFATFGGSRPLDSKGGNIIEHAFSVAEGC